MKFHIHCQSKNLMHNGGKIYFKNSLELKNSEKSEKFNFLKKPKKSKKAVVVVTFVEN